MPEPDLAALAAAFELAFREPGVERLVQPAWRKIRETTGIPSTGFCYIAAEAAFHQLGGRAAGWTPWIAKYEEFNQPCVHRWLTAPFGGVFDPTASQYAARGVQPPYAAGRRCGFMTPHLSKRAAALWEIVSRFLAP